MLTRTKTAATIAAAALAGGGAGAGIYAALDAAPQTAAAPAASTTAENTASTAKTLGVNQIYETAGAGTVEITATGAASSSGTIPYPWGGDGGSGGQSQKTSAQGSGFVYDTAGHVVTNEHVVDGASSFEVAFPNGKSYKATLVGSDPSTDLAVLKVDAPASVLKPLALGDSSAVEVGDGVVAIGSPFGLDNSVTTGIVSALHRQIQAPNQFAIDDAIQTDAAINHGNSGGPLLNMQGQVIGVNAQIDSESGGNDGVGFAIPSDTVRSIVPRLIDAGSVEHAYLGVAIQSASKGAEVTSVTAGTPAAKAGLQAGDVITKADGAAVGSDELRAAIDAKQPGEKIALTYLREGATHTVTVTLASRPS